MTPSQEISISKAMSHIEKARHWLDNAMYHSGVELNDSEFRKVREAYELLCQANDKL
jgi:hypothetical protein